MGRSLRTAAMGWAVGFAVALALGGFANRARDPRLSSVLLTLAAIGGLLIAALVLISGIADLMNRRSADRPATADRADAQPPPAPPRAPAQETAPAATPASSAATTRAPTPDHTAAAARIAMLEAQLAEEEEQLRAAAEALAATESLAAVHAENARRIEAMSPNAAAEEPALRQELLDAVAELVGRDARPGPDVARQVAELLDKAG